MVLSFKFRKEKSLLFGEIYRPIAQVFFWSKIAHEWIEVWMIVDTGADYTLLPHYLVNDLGIDLESDCRIFSTGGIGGIEKVYLLKEKLKVKLGKWEEKIPIGFLERDEIPPLLGRQDFLEKFETLFSKNHVVSFSK